MRLSTISTLAALLVAPAFAVGCASPAQDDAGESDNAVVLSGAEFKGAVGAIEVDGKQVCTATYVDFEGQGLISRVVNTKASEVIMSGACVGQLKTNGRPYFGGAAFVTTNGNEKVRVPLLSVTEKHGAGAGLAAGVLARPLPGIAPISALATASLDTGYKVAIFENGKLLDVQAKAAGDVASAFGLAHCGNVFAGGASSRNGGAAGVSIGADGVDVTAVALVDGKALFLGALDPRCELETIGAVGGGLLSAVGGLVSKVVGLGAELAELGLDVAQDGLVAVYDVTSEVAKDAVIVAVEVPKGATQVVIQSAAFVAANAPSISASGSVKVSGGVRCSGRGCSVGVSAQASGKVFIALPRTAGRYYVSVK